MRKNSKILSQNSVFEIAHRLRKQGKVVGLTHGAFDLFHVSHLDLLRKSKELCDFLIVGVDSDESIKKYKQGVGPIIDLQNRLKILNTFNFINGLYINYDFDTADEHQEFYKEIRPHLITIGCNNSQEEYIKNDTRKISLDLIKVNTLQTPSIF